MNIIILGPQGSGKGTQAQLLSKKYGYKHLSTGDIIRQGIEKKDPAALAIEKGIAQGKLVPDKLILKLVKQNLVENNILDGVPRTITQAEALDEITNIDLVIELQLTDEEGIKRLSSRQHCPKCRAIYGQESPPKNKNTCDKDGTKLAQREDDKPEAIKKRLETYREETEPLIEYYRPRHIVHSINAGRKIDEVFKEVCMVIDSHQGEGRRY
ncbi:nucleoside monophosphate kinase [Candidatus Woesearchaeota archaeon]|nr:nucleoside monophosphate kinase [Candidatus Woesearchaeota archaeon]